MNEIDGICCEVNNCKYHEPSNKCSAGHIKVGCDCPSAHNVKDTICETFEECDNKNCSTEKCDDDCNCESNNCR